MSNRIIRVVPDVSPRGHRTGKIRVVVPGGPKGHHTRTRVFDSASRANDFASRLGKRAGVPVETIQVHEAGAASGSTKILRRQEAAIRREAEILLADAKRAYDVEREDLARELRRRANALLATISNVPKRRGAASGSARSSSKTWRGEYENERVFEHTRLNLNHLKLWGAIGRAPVARCAVTEERALHTLDEAVAVIANLDAQTPPASKRRWKSTMVAELTRLLGEAQAVVEGKKPASLVKSADDMVDLIVATRKKQGRTDVMDDRIFRNVARLIGAGGVCGLEDLAAEIYQKKHAGRSNGRSRR